MLKIQPNKLRNHIQSLNQSTFFRFYNIKLCMLREIFDAKIWNAIVKNYEMIQGAQVSNSFILLMVLNETTQPLSTTRISELISKRGLCRNHHRYYKISQSMHIVGYASE